MATSTAQLLNRMTDLEHQDVDRTFLGHLYGPPGTGKTTLALWLAQNLITETGRIAYIDSAEGWVSLNNTPSLKQGVDRLPYDSYGDLTALADAIRRGVKGFQNIEVVVIDEIDSIADDVLVTVVREKHGTPANSQLPEIEGKDYRPMGDLMRLAIKDFQKAGVHLILVSHDKIRKDHRKVEITGPSITPQLNTAISGLMHVVGYTSAEIRGTAAKPEYIRSIQTLPTALVQAKTRVGALAQSVKVTHEEFVNIVADWVADISVMAADLAAPELDAELLPDELPTDGIPISDEPVTDEDDEPAFVSTD